MSQAARYVRQVLLPEIGEAGQRGLAAATAAVAGPSLAHEVGALYAKAAGFAAVAPGEIDLDRLAPLDVVTTESARQVLAGARASLAEIRRALSPEAS